ncbi:hypothetical protein A2V82_09405 [candidate division KSB1 bacterium RBG_16_48_16]|nr:MAG: hypothetical protein A2V82_09405 [candidate division KSB1 bacterium RBG_16_48_16]
MLQLAFDLLIQLFLIVRLICKSGIHLTEGKVGMLILQLFRTPTIGHFIKYKLNYFDFLLCF